MYARARPRPGVARLDSRLRVYRTKSNRRLPPVLALINTPGSKRHNYPDDAIYIPLNYAQLLGLRGRDLYLEAQIAGAHDDMISRDLEAAYSSVARLGKEKLLFAAREGLRAARGRVSNVHADTAIEPVLLPGAMALLEQNGHYDLVIQLSDAAARLTPRDLRTGSRSTAQDYERDVALATALAHCGIAKRALDANRPAEACGRLEEALVLLREGAHGGPPLARDLQVNIISTLNDLKPNAVLDYLTQYPLDTSTEVGLRKQAVSSLAGMLRDGTPLTVEYVKLALSALTSEEIVSVYDWEKAAAQCIRHHQSSSKSRVGEPSLPWLDAGSILPTVGLGALVAGFIHCRPELVAMASHVFAACKTCVPSADVAVQLAVCNVLLGRPFSALDILREDEKMSLAARSSRTGQQNSTARKTSISTVADSKLPAFPDRDDVMIFIRKASPGNAPTVDNDLLPGLCIFVERWFVRVAFPRVRDTRDKPPTPSLDAYFDDPRTEGYLDAVSSGAQGRGWWASQVFQVLQNLKTFTPNFKTAFNWSRVKLSLPVYVGAIILLAMSLGPTMFAASRKLISSKGPAQSRAGTAESVSRLHQRKNKGIQAPQTRGIPTVDEVHGLVKKWLQVKAEAMGPRHVTSGLTDVLVDPMLKAVESEAKEAKASGWFWNIRLLRLKIESLDGSRLSPGGDGGRVVVVATVQESADLWATNGKKGDSYKTEYRVEYSVVPARGGWRLESALVLGK